MKIAIVGSSDLGQLMAYHAVHDRGYELYGFFDNKKEKGTKVEEYGTVVGRTDEIEEHFLRNLFDGIILGIGYTQFDFKKSLYRKYSGKVPFINIIHSSCYVDKSVQLGSGVFMLPGCVIDMGSWIGDNVVLNTGVIIAHHSVIGNNSFLGPAVAVAGYVKIGEANFIGINSTIVNHIEICDDIIVGANTLVNKSISEKGTYIGIPSRKFIK